MLTNLFSSRFTRAKRISSSWILHKKRATDRIWTGDLILTKDALYQLSYCSFLLRSVGLSLARLRLFLERKTGLEPATYSLEGYRSTKWATSASLVLVFRGGGWTRTTELFRGQIYSLLQLPLCDFPIFLFRCSPFSLPGSSSSRWRDSNPRQADYKSATLPTELHRLVQLCQTTLCSLVLRLQRYYFFRIPQIFFLFFFKLFFIVLIVKQFFLHLISPPAPPLPCFLPFSNSISALFHLQTKASHSLLCIINCISA